MEAAKWIVLKGLLEEAMDELMDLKANPEIVGWFNNTYAFTNAVTKHQEAMNGNA